MTVAAVCEDALIDDPGLDLDHGGGHCGFFENINRTANTNFVEKCKRSDVRRRRR